MFGWQSKAARNDGIESRIVLEMNQKKFQQICKNELVMYIVHNTSFGLPQLRINFPSICTFRPGFQCRMLVKYSINAIYYCHTKTIVSIQKEVIHIKKKKNGREWTNRDEREKRGENSNRWNIIRKEEKCTECVVIDYMLIFSSFPRFANRKMNTIYVLTSGWTNNIFCYILEKYTRESPMPTTHANKVRFYDGNFHLNTKCIMWKMYW